MADLEHEMMPLLRGDLTRLPPQDSTVVRIFVSSTFGGDRVTISHCSHRQRMASVIFFPTDFVHERNKLMQEAFPALQRYCQSLGLELQVVDMRWGVRDESISYHLTSDVCLHEVELCKQLSVGPSFIVSL